MKENGTNIYIKCLFIDKKMEQNDKFWLSYSNNYLFKWPINVKLNKTWNWKGPKNIRGTQKELKKYNGVH